MSQGLDKCKRIMQVLWTKRDEKGLVSFAEVERTVFKYATIDKRQFKRYLEVLRKLGWLKRINRHRFRICSEYLTEDF